LLLKPALLVVLDDVEGAGEMLVEQFWHAGQEVRPEGGNVYRLGGCARLMFPAPAAVSCEWGGEHGWRSRVFGTKEAAPVLRVEVRQAARVSLAAALAVRTGAPAGVNLRVEGAGRRVWCAGGMEIVFPEAGRPEVLAGR